MIADRKQLDLWREILDRSAGPRVTTRVSSAAGALRVRGLPDNALLDIDTEAGVITHGKGRPLLIAILTVLDYASSEHLIATVGTRLPKLGAVPDRRPAAQGGVVADAVWRAYFQWRLGVPAADSWLRSFIDTLAPTALVFTHQDNPEPWWQAEMIILHAVHSFALRAYPIDVALLEKTLACADFHLREIQPDHATNEPWAVHAYASHSDGNVTAETLLHAGYLQHGGRLGPVARLIARDAADALATYLKA